MGLTISLIILLIGFLLFIFIIIWVRREINSYGGFRGSGKEARLENKLLKKHL